MDIVSLTVLFITSNLKSSIQNKKLKKYFWYLKTSKVGKDDTNSGEVIYPSLEDDGSLENKKANQNQNHFDIKQIRMNGSVYKLRKNQIRHWIELNEVIVGDL
jgi:hypothetical protein